MRRTRNRAFALTAGIAGAALVLSGCGSSKDETGTGTETGGTDQKITLRLATFNEFGYEDLITEYMAANPNITIEHTKAATSQEARDNMNTRLAAGSGLADIEAIEVDWLPELMQYPDEFVDLTDPAVADRWLPWKVAQATTADGKLIGYGTDIGPEGVCYRSDLFAAAGLPTDREAVAALLEGGWDTYFQVGQQFAAASDVPWFDSAGGIYQGMINQEVTPYEKTDGTPIPLADNSTVEDIYNQVLTASTDLSAHLTQWSDDWVSAFQSNGFATMLCPGWMLGVIEGNAAGVTGWDIADVYPGGGGNWGGSFLTVPTQGPNQDAAKALAQWLTAPEQQIKAFVSKGTFPSQVEALTSPDLLDQTNAFFNNAPTGQILADRAKAIPAEQPFKGPNYFGIHTTVSDAITRVDVDQTDDAASSWQKALEAYAALGL